MAAQGSGAKMASQQEIRDRITARIVAALRAGTAPWRKPWSDRDNTGSPANVISRRPYSGVNPLLLDLAAQERGWTSRWWGTFNQWRSLGLRVQARPADVPPGQWGIKVVFCKGITKRTTNERGEEEEDQFFLLREYTVFNAEQVEGDGIEEYRVRPRPGPSAVDFGPAEEVIQATGADIRFGGNRAFYRPDEDFIRLPPKDWFVNRHEFYTTCLHELVHWTGHGSRLARLDQKARFGNESYALEELVAEIGGCFLCSAVRVPQSDDLTNQAAYLGHWLKVLQQDHRAIFRASSQASAAADYILAFSRQAESGAAEGSEAAACVTG
jgi:antirestriction protein ArdC